MAVFKLNNSPFYHYDFRFQGQRFRGTTKETDQAAAEKVEARLEDPVDSCNGPKKRNR